MSSLKVAAAQIECRPGDVSANLGLHLAAIDEARGLGVDVLVFPELSLTDYLAAPDVPTLALASSAAELERLVARSAALGYDVSRLEFPATAPE
jgi:predicted amidohydrolase